MDFGRGAYGVYVEVTRSELKEDDQDTDADVVRCNQSAAKNTAFPCPAGDVVITSQSSEL